MAATLVVADALSTSLASNVKGATGAVNATTPTVVENEITVHKISVGETQHYFTPNSINALPGDIVMFTFWPGNHSVIRAEYGFPCVPYEDLQDNEVQGFYSGMRTPSANDLAQGEVCNNYMLRKITALLINPAATCLEFNGQHHVLCLLLLWSAWKLCRMGYVRRDQRRCRPRYRDANRDGKGRSKS
jgi:plastocyanin